MGEIRASDDDRERVAVVLREHYAAGRLSDDELSTRLDRAYGAGHVTELEHLTLDLPAADRALPPAPQRKREVTRGGHALRMSLRIHATIYVLVNALLVAIWAVSGGGYFWPIWSIIGWGFGVAGHAAPVLAGAGTRHARIGEPASVKSLAESVSDKRPDLRPATAPDGTVTILFSDIENSTSLNDRLGDLRWLELLREHHALVRAQIAEHDGYEVKTQGDGFMIVFASARSALLCGHGIQQAIATGLADHPDGPVGVRIGLHTGEAVREEDDFYGLNVALAARITEQARAGEVLASAVVRDLTISAGDITFDDPRDVDLKGLGAQTVFRTART